MLAPRRAALKLPPLLRRLSSFEPFVATRNAQAQLHLDNDFEAHSEKRIPIKAYYLGRNINVTKAGQKLFPGSSFQKTSRKKILRDSLLFSFQESFTPTEVPDLAQPTSHRSLPPIVESSRGPFPESASHAPFGTKHLVVFNYGSVVFFDFQEAEILRYLTDLRGATSESIPYEFMIKEDYTVVERPHLRESCVLTNDLTILREMDLHSCTVISTIMAQTVALDHYSALVDEMLDIFTGFNHSVEKTGKFDKTGKVDLFKLIAQNNAVLIAVLSKISLLERSDIAWKMPQYVHVWEGLRTEFEIDDRFENLKYKLELIKENSKFFLEIMHNNKSNMLEIIIIVLIAAEIVVCSMELCEVKPAWVIEQLSTLFSASPGVAAASTDGGQETVQETIQGAVSAGASIDTGKLSRLNSK